MPTREGYTFLYWYKGDNIYDFNDIVTEDFTLVAIWEANEYEITWIVDGVSHVELHKYDTIPEFKGDTSKESDEVYDYEFIGWDNEVSKVTGKITYIAQYKKTYIDYEIKFVDEDGSLISSEKYHYGDKVVLPVDPSKEATAQYTYTFSGWDNEVVDVVGNATYTATYSSVVNEYEVEWIVNGVSTKETYKYGETPNFKGSTSKAADNTYTYEFAGWDKGVEKVTGEVTYTAKYNPIYIEYEIKFVDEDGSLISSEKYHYGDKVELPSNPSKEATAQYTYTFSGWDKTVVDVAGNATYKATYLSVVNEYEVEWIVDGVSTKEAYKYGDVPSFEGSTSKAADNTYTYAFDGWDKEVSMVTGDVTYTAQYKATYIEYEIKFVNEDGTLISSEKYHYGDKVVVPTDPSKEATAQYTYTFSGWDKEVVDVVGSTTYKATYSSVINEYTITWSVNGTSTKEIYKFGEVPCFKGSTSKPADKTYTYEFDSWDKEVSIVTREVTYTAQYKETYIEYEVNWIVDGVTTTENYHYGETPSFKGSTSKAADKTYTYEFDSWDKAINKVTGDVTYVAKYNPIYIEYEIKFVDEDETLISSEKYHYGDKVVLPSNPSKEATAQYTYTFNGWDKEVVDVVGSTTYKATYSSVVNEYKVTWVVNGVSTEETYKYGETPCFKGITSKPADKTYTYEFTGWDKEVSMVTGEVTYTAKYNLIYIEYEVKFLDEDGSLISSEKYHYGDAVQSIIYPVKPSTAQYTYTFNGWDKPVSKVTGDTVYRATYIATLNMYNINFVDEYGLTIVKEKVYYGDLVSMPIDPIKKDYIFLGWFDDEVKYDFDSPIVGELTLTAKWLPITYVSLNDFVDKAYDTIKNQNSIDKFIVSKSENSIHISIIDKNMNSVNALAGTGIATAAEDLLNTLGVKSVKISIPGENDVYVEITSENLRSSLSELDALFKYLAGSENATVEKLIGKSISISIDLDYGYQSLDSNNFIVDFNYELNINQMVEDAYLLIKDTVSDDKFEVYKTGNAIKLNIYDKTMNSIYALSGTGIATAAEDLLSTSGIKSVVLTIPGTDIYLELTTENLFSKLGELESLFIILAGSENATAAELIGKSLEVSIILEEGYFSDYSHNFTILFAEPDVLQVTFNTDGGNYINPELVYFERYATVPNTPVKEGHTFKYWSLNGVEFDFNTLIISDIELIAVWEINQYNVIFKNANGDILSNRDYYYGESILVPINPTMDSNRIYSYVFKGWDYKISSVKENIIYTAIYDIVVNVDVLVDDSYDIIKEQVTEDKFSVSKSENTIIVNIADLTMESVVALKGTGIVTAAEKMLTIEGVKSITIFIPGTDVSVEVTKDNLMGKIGEIDALFNCLSNTSNASTADLIGKGLRITINLNSGYITNNDATFAISFTSDFDTDKMIEKSYNNILSIVPSSSANIVLSNKNINIIALDTKSNTTALLMQSSIINAIEGLLKINGVEEVSIHVPSKNIVVDIKTNNLTEKIVEIESLFRFLVDSNEFNGGNLAGSILDISIKVKDGFIVDEQPKFTITFDAIYTVDYNVDGNKTSVKVDYNDYLDEPTIPTKVGYTFSHWELNGEKYEFNKPVTSDMELVAIWNINKYEINFISNNNEYGLLNKTSIVVDYGTKITISNNQLIIGEEVVIAIPTIANAQYTYYFKEWSNVPTNLLVEGDMTIEALFDNYVNEYEVEWIVDGASTKETYKYGDVPTFKGSTSKAADKTYTYEFTGWDKAINKVTGDVTYVAKYNPIYIEYEIKFVDEAGSLISSENYHYGDKVVLPSNPSKEATAQYTYTFAGWDNEVVDVVGNATYTATYSSVVNEYTITWIVNGTSTKEIYKYGDVPIFKGSTSKPADKTYTYEFDGWDKETIIVTGDVTYIARYKETYIEYEVGWIVDGVTTKENYHYGETPSFKGSTSKAADKTYTYEFAGWDKAINKVTGDVTYIAEFNPIYIEYEVNWIVDEVTTTENYHYEEMPNFKGSTLKPADKTYIYEFVGWDKEVSKVTGDIVYTAQYKKTYIEYEIKFVDEDGSLISSEKYHYGDKVVLPSNPKKEATAQYTYTFSGWDKEVVDVVGNTTYKATYSSVVNEYTVSWRFAKGGFPETYKYGEMPVFTSDLSKDADETYTYEFIGWDKEISIVTGDVTYTAQYKATYIEYEVKWIVDGVTTKENYHYGEEPSFKGNTDKLADNTYTYEFDGWDKEVSMVTGDVTYTAQYNPIYIEYEIGFADDEGRVVCGGYYHYGDVIDVPPAPNKEATAQYTYVFAGWDKEVGIVTGNVIYYATYTPILNEYKVSWRTAKGGLTETYKYGEMPTFTLDVSKDADNTYTYEFIGWDKEISIVTGDVTYTAQYKATYIEYEIKFVDEDETLISSEKYHYGDKVVVPTNPSKEATAQYTYTFSGWDKEVVDVVSSTTYKATYSSVVNEYEVEWNVEGVSTKETYKYGEMPNFKGNTNKLADNIYTYEFAGWDKEVSMVIGEVTYTAQYKATYIEYEVKFVDEDGSLISSEKYHYGDKVALPSNPKKEATAQYTYTFSGWDKEVVDVVDNTTYKATYTSTVNKYTIKFVNYDDSVISSTSYEYGSTVTPPTATRSATAQYTYIFSGWDKAISTVTGDATYKATYKSTVNKYTIKFVNYDDSVISSISYEYGSTVTPPTATRAATAQYTYTFAGWDKALAKVTKNETYKATYTSVVNEYTITWNVSGTVTKEVYKYGATPSYKGTIATKAADANCSNYVHYWNPDVVMVTGNATYELNYACGVSVDQDIDDRLATFDTPKFDVDKNGDKVNVNFTSYDTGKWWMDGTVPHSFSDIFDEVLTMFDILSSDERYESVVLYTLHPNHVTTPSKAQSIDLKKYDLNDSSSSSWFGDGANDDISNWVGYLTTGSLGTMNAYLSDTDDLVGKIVVVTIKLKEGYRNSVDSSDTIVYNLTFSSD